MNFEKFAFVYDSNVLKGHATSSIYSVMTIVGSPVVFNPLLKDSIERWSLSTMSGDSIEAWLFEQNHFHDVIRLLSALTKNREKIELVSFFIEKQFSYLLICLGLMSKDFMAETPKLAEEVNKLYDDYLHYKKGIAKNDDSGNMLSMFDFVAKQRISCHRYQGLADFFKEPRSIEELNILKKAYEKNDINVDNILSEFSYARFFADFITKKDVKQVKASTDTGEKIRRAMETSKKNYYFSIRQNLGNNTDTDFTDTIAHTLLMVSEYSISKICGTSDVKSISSEDRLLFIMVWILFQGNENGWFMSKNTFGKIEELFNSLRKSLNV